MLKKTIEISLMSLFLVFCIKAQSQREMTAKACDSSKKAENKMNQMYRQIIQEYKEDTVFVEKFKKSQDAWLVYREAQIEAISPTRSETARGSAYPMCSCMLEEYYISQRIKEFQPWLQGEECCDVCGESYKIRKVEPKVKSKIKRKTK
jgi:uncharacterized protein YecT (DUF1311 family)